MKLSETRLIGDYILAAADSKYFLEHAQALINSCYTHNNKLHLHIINPTEKCIELAIKNKISFSIEESKTTTKTYYACNRFLTANELKSSHNRLLILDIDCFLQDHLIFPDSELGLFFREPFGTEGQWVNRGSKVAAGIVYLGYNSKDYISLVAENLKKTSMDIWYTDQVILYEVYKDIVKDTFHFDSSWLDWEFKEGTKIWTGKGNRKTSNQKYLKEKKFYEHSHV